MSTPAKLVGFLAALAAIFGITLLVGRAVGPVDDAAPAGSHDGSGAHAEGATGEPPSTGVAALPGGLMASQGGYTLALGQQHLKAGSEVPMTFTITGPDGAPVTAYDVEQETQT